MCFALLTIVVDAVFSDEYKYGTLKNTISFGISRAEIYFGKLIVEIILMLVTIALVLVVYTASGLFFHRSAHMGRSNGRRYASSWRKPRFPCHCGSVCSAC